MTNKMLSGTVSMATVIGSREYQEDRVMSMELKGVGCNGWLLAAADGHNGSEAAEICIQLIPQIFTLKSATETEQAMKDLFQRLDKKTAAFDSGAAVSVACVLESHNNVTIAILGDAPVLVLHQDGTVHKSPDHNVRNNLAERQAAEMRGGCYFENYLRKFEDGPGVQFSRGLGDECLRPIISGIPEIYKIDHPQWICVATDGILDPSHYEDIEPLPSGLCTLCKSRASAEDVMKWVCGPAHDLRDNASVVVWKP